MKRVLNAIIPAVIFIYVLSSCDKPASEKSSSENGVQQEISNAVVATKIVCYEYRSYDNEPIIITVETLNKDKNYVGGSYRGSGYTQFSVLFNIKENYLKMDNSRLFGHDESETFASITIPKPQPNVRYSLYSLIVFKDSGPGYSNKASYSYSCEIQD